MGIEVELPDGRVIEVDTDDPQVAARAAHTFQQRQQAAQREREFRAPRTNEQMRSGRAPGGGRDIPVPGWLQPIARGIEDFNRSGIGATVSQAWRQVPFSDEAARLFGGEGNEQYLRDERERVAREQPGVNTAATAMNVIGMAGNPTAALPRIGMLEGGAAAAGVNAPFALARQDGPIEDRIPGALQEEALMFGLGAGLTGAGNLLSRAPPNAGRITANADRLGIPPNMATSGGPLSRMATKFASESLFAGGRTRRNLTAALEGTRDAAGRLAAQYAGPTGREGMGDIVQRGLQRFATEGDIPNPSPGTHPMRVSTREWSHASKAGAVFDHALRPIASNPATTNSTQATLRSIMGRADSEAVRVFREDPVLRQFMNTLDETPNPTLRDLRELRRGVREAQNRPALDGQSVDNAALQRLEQSLTEDMYASAGPAAAQLQRADEFYRIGRERIARALEAVGGRNANPGQTYRAILAAANQRTPNTRALIELRRALRDDEWRVVAASLIDHMGAPTPGASGIPTDIGFSVHNFATAYRMLSPQARRILFGSVGQSRGVAATRALAQDLDDLAEIALRQKAIENMGTPSGRDAQNALMIGAGAFGQLPAAVGIMGSVAITGEMLTNPAFVRWLTSASRSGTAGGARANLSALAQIAARDPAIVPYYEAVLAQRTERQSASPATRQAELAPQ